MFKRVCHVESCRNDRELEEEYDIPCTKKMFGQARLIIRAVPERFQSHESREDETQRCTTDLKYHSRRDESRHCTTNIRYETFKSAARRKAQHFFPPEWSIRNSANRYRKEKFKLVMMDTHLPTSG